MGSITGICSGLKFLSGFACAIVCLSFDNKPKEHKSSRIRLTIECKGAVTHYSVRTALLKYDKDFAWSFALDDGLASGWLVAFPFLNGGRVAPSAKPAWDADQGGDGKDYPGLFFTDGCGNKLPFRAAVAINAKKIGQPGFLSWGQIDSLYKAGWDVFNHGYAHLTGGGVDADFECRENNRVVKERLGIGMRQFVVPGGAGDTISEAPYTTAAFGQGMEAVHDGHFPSPIVCVDSGLSLKQMRPGRQFLYSGTMRDSIDSYFREIDHWLQTKKHFWINAFTHSTGNDNLWKISLRFPDTKLFFERFGKEYGEKGRDNSWVASYQAVQEYSLIHQSLVYSVHKEGKRIVVEIDTEKLPKGLHHQCQTFVLDSDQPIANVTCAGCSVESYSGNTGAHGLINLQWR